MVQVAKRFEADAQNLRARLTATERKAVDANQDGELSDVEATAAARTADVDGDGFVSTDELANLKKLLGEGFSTGDHGRLKSGLLARSKQLAEASEAKIAASEARAKSLKESLGSSTNDRASDLRKKLAELPTEKSLDTTIQTKTAELASAETELAALARDKKAAADFVKRNPAYQNGGAIVDNTRREVKRLEAIHERAPTEASKANLDAAQSRFEAASKKAAEFKRSEDILRNEPERRASLEKKIERSNEEIQAAQSSKAQLPETRKKLEKQLELAELSESLGTARLEASSFRALSGRATRALGSLEDQAKRRIESAEATLASATTAVAESQHPATKTLLEVAQTSKAVLDGVASGALDAKHVDVEKAEKNYRMATSTLANINADVERSAKKLVATLEDPSFKDALALMPEKQRTELLSKITKTLPGSEAGQRFFDRGIAPVFEGKDGNPIWKGLRDGAQGSDEAATVLMESVTAFSGYMIAKRGGAEAVELASKGLTVALGLRPDQLPVLENAIQLRNAGKEGEALRLLEKSSVGRLGKVLGAASNTLTSVAALAAAFELANDPSAKNLMDAGKGAAEVTEFMARFATRSSAMAKYSKLVGAAHVAEGFASKVVPVLDIAMGVYGLTGKDGAIARGDTAGTFGHYLQAAGGSTALAGGLVSLAPPLVPLGVLLGAVGGIMAGTGTLVEAIWGQSETEKLLNKHLATAIYVR
ncbi:MAG: hypothetical protein HYV07_09145 [Deltaproteobacteria bacterium]|nr:hypothetical protein [Deltaproteobacteria bacterium]